MEDITNDWLQPPDDKIDFAVQGDITVFRSEYEDVKVHVIGRVTEDGFVGDWGYDDSFPVSQTFIDEYLCNLEPSDFVGIEV